MNALILLVEKALYPVRVIKNYFGRFAKFGRKSPKKMTLAGKVGIAFFVCLALFLIAALVLHWTLQVEPIRSISQGVFGFETAVKWLDYPIYFLIALFCSIGVYWGIRLATLERPSLYPEIDQSWEAMEKWREDQNLDWQDFDRMLVLGPSYEVSKAMHSDVKAHSVGPLPRAANEWMHWFGSAETMYLHLKSVCNVNDAVEKCSASKGVAPRGHFQTLEAPVGVPEWSVDFSGEQPVDSLDATENVSLDQSVSFESLDPTDTLDPFDADAEGGESAEKKKKAVPKDDSAETEDSFEEDDKPVDRLRYLCELIKRKTDGNIPFSGVMIVIPFDRFNSSSNYKLISAAVREDLIELRKQIDVAFSVSFIFCSMEKDKGFPKLQNLLGAKRAASGRFGAGCQTTDVPEVSKTNLKLQVRRACQTFDTWVFDRWKKSSQISRATQNKELFKMVARIRKDFQPKLEYLMEQSLVWEDWGDEEAQVYVAGCYFASTGSSSAERGFLAGVYSKCEDFSELASWGDSVLSRDRIYSTLASLLFAGSFLAVVGVLVYTVMRGS